MTETSNEIDSKRFAVVTGANKGIGFEICRQLASQGITTVLTARDVRRGLEAFEKLKISEISDYVKFHHLDVSDPSSITSLAVFVKSQFIKLDILVNNAGIIGATLDPQKFSSAARLLEEDENSEINWEGTMTQSYEEATQCLQTNYYGAKRMSEELIPLLQLSDSPRIVNVSSGAGKLKNIPNDWAKEKLRDAKNDEGSIDEVIEEFLKDFKDGNLAAKNWPNYFAAYIVSKAAMNPYTKILARRCPRFKVNAVCPGFVKTDIALNAYSTTAEEGAERVVRIALMPNDGPSGMFFVEKEAYND